MKTTKNKFKVSAHAYRRPTPAKWRQVGDALLVSSTIVSAQTQNPTVAIVSQIAGVLGKFLTNFFHE